MNFSLKDVRCYTQKMPDTFTNLGFYLTFNSKIDRFCFTSDYPPESKKFRCALLNFIRSKIEESKKHPYPCQSALSSYLIYLDTCQQFLTSVVQAPRTFPRDLVDSRSKVERCPKDASPDVRILFSILQALTKK